MPWMSGVIRNEVARHRTRMTARRFVFHTAVSGASSLFGYFNIPGNPTSHFYVRADGTVEQYVNTDYQAPAQLEGNHDCVSVETQDMDDGFPAWSGSDVPAWSSAQVTALARIAAWVASTHQIPLLMLPDSRNGRTGYGYHRLGVDPWRVAGGELWSTSYGKVCPGDRRIAQIPTILTNAAQGDDMPLTTSEMQAIADWVWAKKATQLSDGVEKTLFDILRITQESARQGSLDRRYDNMTDESTPTAGDLIRFAHKEAFDAAHRELPPPVVDLPADLAGQVAAALAADTEFLAAIADAVDAEGAVRRVLGGLDNPPA